MPYGIADNQPDCDGWAMVKQNADGSFETLACYTNKQEAIDYMVAASLGDEIEPIGEVREAIDLSPPEYMREAARRGLKYHEQGLSGDGIVPQTVEDARKMASGTVTEEKWRKIAPWIARHMTDLDAIQGDEITAGFVAHLLWGSDGTKEGARRAMNYAEQVVNQLDAQTNNGEERQLPPSYRPADSEDVPTGRNCGNCEYFNAEMGMCSAFNETVDAAFYCDRWEPTESDDAEMSDEMEVDESGMMMGEMEMDSRTNGWVVAEKENRSIAYSNFEMRAAQDGNTLVGYAAVFDSPSEPLPWTEFVRRGAFTKTIKDGADVRLLIDHEGVPLARTRSGTLTLIEDEIGLRIEANLDEANPDAAKAMSALRRGDVSQMSFAFQTVKDAWSTDKRTRELKEVRLYDVSIVTYPAYEETVAELRNRNNTQADTVPVVAPIMLRKRQIQLRQAQAEN
jgi:HK97 family phage prohead protease